MGDTASPDSRCTSHGPCPRCGSRDNLARYDDGHAHCFTPGCGYFERANGTPTQKRHMTSEHDFLRGDVVDLDKRGIFAATCEKFGYRRATDRNGKTVQVADYRNAAGHLVMQKLRYRDKEFRTVGDTHRAPLFGQHLWRGGGKRLVITEGEIDALSVAQVMNLSWPVVSIPLGAGNAERAIRDNIDWIENYQQVVFMFDMDDAGRTAAQQCAALLKPGLAAIAELPLKDANVMLDHGRTRELMQAIYEARPYRPGGIVNGADLWDAMQQRMEPGLPYPWPALTLKTYGMHKGSIVTFTSGTGMGKSTIVGEIGYDMLMKGHTVGHVALEENVGRTALNYVGRHLHKRIALLDDAVDQAELKEAFAATMGTGRFWTFDHFGSLDDGDLLSKIKYLIVGCGCDVVILDHLSIVVSGMDEGSDERKTIDRVMTRLRALVEETGVILLLVCHLRRTSGTAHEEGGKISLADLRGSQGIAQISDLVIGLERDQQAEDESDRCNIQLRVLKNRMVGITGIAGHLRYDATTGILNETDAPEFADATANTDF